MYGVIDQTLEANVFGWGAGGADKIGLIAQVLYECGFKKVVGLLDANKAGLLDGLRAPFTGYHFDSIPADDIRTKSATPARKARPGLLNDQNKQVREELKEASLRSSATQVTISLTRTDDRHSDIFPMSASGRFC